MGCKKLTYHETLSPLKAVCNDLNVSGISCVGSYRYGFNSMEKDDNIKGEGNSYDFGARIYDPRVGRWLSRDPQAGKYTSWSPYHFGYNNPIITIDPNGEENIIVVNLDNHGDRMKKEMGLNVDIQFVDDANSLINYINSGSTSNSELSEKRLDDKVTDLIIYSHGVVAGHRNGDSELGSITPAIYSGDSETNNKFMITGEIIDKIDPKAVQYGNCELESCNSATNNSSGESLASKVSEKFQGTVTGLYGKSDYAKIYDSKTIHALKYGWGGPADNYPTAGQLDDDSADSEKKLYYNGSEMGSKSK